MREVVVVGSGVIGLTCAVALLERGCRVRMFARELAWRTTSAVAAAIWFPYEARPAARVHGWARTTYERFAMLAQRRETGVVMTSGVIYVRAASGPPFWRELVPNWQAAAAAELPPGVVAGDVITVPVAEMPVYLQFLVAEVERRGGRIEMRDVRAFADIDAPAIVNCTGLGARALADDDSLYPIRGQVVSTARVVDGFVIDDDHPGGITYIVPRAHDCVLGGSAEPFVGDLAPRAAEAQAVHARCASLRPALRNHPVLAVRVGLRPGRPTVRLECEPIGGRRIVHNYGHGGSGMTLSWGCAFEAAGLVLS